MNSSGRAGGQGGWGRRCVALMDRHYLPVVTIVLLLVYFFTYLGLTDICPIRADGAGYYAYLPSLLLYADPSFETDAEVHYGGQFPRWTYVWRYPPTGRYLNTYNMGVALFIAPFFAVGHGLTCWFGWPWDGGWPWMQMRFAPNGYTLFYQHAAGLAGVFYFLVGFALLRRFLRRLYSAGVTLATLTALLLGTNLLYYAASDTVNAHAFTFFVVAALMTLTSAWYDRPHSAGFALGLGSVAALLVLVRPPNLLFLLWFPLAGVVSWRDMQDRIAFLLRRWKALLTMALAGFLTFVPQALVWKYSTGRFIAGTYQNVGAMKFAAPNVLDVLFGVSKGAFTWYPVLIMAVLGWFVMRGPSVAYRAVTVVLVSLHLLVVSSYALWAAAGGFGNRYIVDAVIFMAFPLASFFSGLESRWTRWVIGGATALCILYALFLMTLLYRREMTFYGLDARGFFDVFWWRKAAFLEWWSGR